MRQSASGAVRGMVAVCTCRRGVYAGGGVGRIGDGVSPYFAGGLSARFLAMPDARDQHGVRIDLVAHDVAAATEADEGVTDVAFHDHAGAWKER
jgi:hypothetical protein